jgi:hypothetical protein
MVRPIVNAVQLLGFLSTIVALSVLAGVGIFWMKSDLICAINPPDSWLSRLLHGEPDNVSVFVFRALPFVVAYNLLLSLCVFVFCIWRFRMPGSKRRLANRRLDAERQPLTESGSSKASWVTAQTSVTTSTLMAPMNERRANGRLPMEISYYDNCHQAVSETEFRQQLADETDLRRAADIRGF